jgi:hypothetical protein
VMDVTPLRLSKLILVQVDRKLFEELKVKCSCSDLFDALCMTVSEC